MKKLLLLAALIPMSFLAHAQQANKAIEPYHIRNTGANTAAKSTIAGGRWYNHAFVVNNDILPGQMKMHLFPIWYDSSVLQNYTTGLAPIEYISAAQIVDPIHFTLYNDNTVPSNLPNDIAITNVAPYKVDSISFAGAYIKNPDRPANIVDTLIFSVSATSTSIVDSYSYYGTTATYHVWAANYVNPNSDDSVLKGYTIDSLNIDIPNRASNVVGRIWWKILLTDADRQAVSGDSVDVVNFTYPVMVNGIPGVCNIPPGYGVAVTVTFKSGDTIVPNVDTFTEYHHLLLSSGEAAGDSTTMPYYRYIFRDRNMSNLMFSSNDSVYQPSVFLDGISNSSFGYEFHNISAHIVCDDCPTVTEICCPGHTSSIAKPTSLVYPNPANESLTISFAQSQNDDVSVSIINAIGQVVTKKEIDKGKVNQTNKMTLSTSDLPEGIYFYIIRTNGTQTSGRFTVLH